MQPWERGGCSSGCLGFSSWGRSGILGACQIRSTNGEGLHRKARCSHHLDRGECMHRCEGVHSIVCAKDVLHLTRWIKGQDINTSMQGSSLEESAARAYSMGSSKYRSAIHERQGRMHRARGSPMIMVHTVASTVAELTGTSGHGATMRYV